MNNLMTRAEIDALHTKTFTKRIALNSHDIVKIIHTIDLLVKKSKIFILPSGERAILLELKIILSKSKKLIRIKQSGLKLVEV